jgi:hypothetical protein
MAKTGIDLMAHLMRRAGFGASRSELERRLGIGYEATVDELLNPEDWGIEPLDEALMFRAQPCFEIGGGVPTNSQCEWMYRLINTPRPLEEKMVLFWHQVFATGASKLDHSVQMLVQMRLFRTLGMGSFRDLLLETAKNPAMIFWLDNNQNHKDAPNENWGRELLELFSMGQGNYTEQDVKECARAFTGWTIAHSFPRNPYGRFEWEFEYRPEDHDHGQKTFLGQVGNFDGTDIIDILVKQPATARFIARHLYNFFVADEVQVPSWLYIPSQDPVAINILSETFITSGYSIKETLRTLFLSDFFADESMRFGKVKSPIELVASTMRLIGDHVIPQPNMAVIANEPGYMGQDLLNPPSVEGWHTGIEWIDSGSLLRRINFVADRLGNQEFSGVQLLLDHITSFRNLDETQLVDECLDILGPITLTHETRMEVIAHIGQFEKLRPDASPSESTQYRKRVCEILQLIAATREYQFC